MNEKTVRDALNELAGREVPETLDLWPAMRGRIPARRAPRARQAQRRRLLPATRLGWAVLALAGLLVLGSGVYAVASIVDRLFDAESGLQHARTEGLGQAVNLPQTRDGVTVTIEQVYADANRVAVGLHVQSADGRRFDAGPVTITAGQGKLLPLLSGLGVTGESEIFKVVIHAPLGRHDE